MSEQPKIAPSALLMELTPEQEAGIPVVRDEWIRVALQTGRMPAETKPRIEAAVHAIYAAAGKAPPRVVIVPSPLTMAIAGVMAWHTCAALRGRDDAVRGAVHDAVRGAVAGAVTDAVAGAVHGAVGGAVGDAVGGAVGANVTVAVTDAVDDTVRGAVAGAVEGAVGVAVNGAVAATVNGAVLGAVNGAVGDAVNVTVAGAVDDAVDVTVTDAVNGAVNGEVTVAVRVAVTVAVRDAVRVAVIAAVTGAVRGAVNGAVDGAVGGAVGDAVAGAVHGAVDDTVRGAVRDTVRVTVAGAVGGAKSDLTSWWKAYQGGNAWPGWDAYLDFFFRILGDRPEFAALAEPFQAWQFLARNSGFRFLADDFCLVSELPTTLKTENVNGRHVPHCEDGPTHEWGDGFAIYHWHGVRVDRRIIMEPETITLDEIRRETHAERRRVLRERYGEGRYLVESGAKVIDSDLETARKGAAQRMLVDDGETRWLVGTDGSTQRVYYMPVDRSLTTCRQAHESLCGFPETLIVNKS